jgi:integrase-like protein
MREQRLLQRHRPLRRRRRPGSFRVERPDQLWHMDMTSAWVAEDGWYLNAAIDRCTREIAGWSLELRCRADEAIAVVDRAAARHRIEPGQLTLGRDNGTAYTSRSFRARLADLGITTAVAAVSRPGVAGVHRELLLEAQGARRVAQRVRDARRGTISDRRLHRPPLPEPPSLAARLQDAPGGASDPGRMEER